MGEGADAVRRHAGDAVSEQHEEEEEEEGNRRTEGSPKVAAGTTS